MRPSLPVWLFDLVVVPRHDELPEGGRIVLTEGVLNPLTADGAHNPDAGIILIGGPSRHHDWDKTQMLRQVMDQIP
jgi:mitochondrial fission protein ELM1